MAEKPVRAALGDIWLKCQVCQGGLFRDRGVLLNSTGMEFMKPAWADENATGLICWRCGYVHLFVNKDIKLYRRTSNEDRPRNQQDSPTGRAGRAGQAARARSAASRRARSSRT